MKNKRRHKSLRLETPGKYRLLKESYYSLLFHVYINYFIVCFYISMLHKLINVLNFKTSLNI